ncbi:RagB/SusD family nutrient uptake outer membrane protein [Persicobacter psychrovividus]|uniref:Outer membrane protein n=1 Tax=Persicobacter psychrovividus TaxID=387638 RepID=A0ABN6LAA6_9BACT|nr:outer membrane protein [Persicobacter psychrovividus]
MKSLFFNKKMMVVAIFAATTLTSCLNKLDIKPIDPSQKTSINSEGEYFSYLTKMYAGLANTGQGGSAGGDLGGGDEGGTQYWRVFWNAEEFPTDEVKNTWTDEGAPQMTYGTWTKDNPFVAGLYNRIYYQITATNEFLRQAEKLDGSTYQDLAEWKAEARFLRAYSYWHALDFFGNRVPFVTEKDPIGKFMPKPAGENVRGPELFNYIHSELKAIVGEGDNKDEVLKDAGTAWLGRADKGAAYMLLAKLDLNSEVYLGHKDVELFKEGRAYLEKMMQEGGYSLYTDGGKVGNYESNAYSRLFMADNEKTAKEQIFTISSDGINMTHWGGTTYLIAAATGGKMDAKKLVGIGSGWAGNRTTKTMVENLQKDGNDDRGKMFFTEGQNLEIENNTQFTDGYAVIKWKNIQQDGSEGKNNDGVFASTKIPVFRLADAYLMLAEFDLRIDGAVSAAHQALVNNLRTRAHAAPYTGTMDLNFILNERQRELFWEGHRRTDLIRFHKFVKGLDWAFKGGVAEGKDLPARSVLYPIPSADTGANTNLVQNTGY